MERLNLEELKEQCYLHKISTELIDKICLQIIDGLPESYETNILTEISTIQYDYIAKVLASYVSKDPILASIASIYQVKIYNDVMGTDYLKLITTQYSLGYISEEFYQYVLDNYEILNKTIKWDRDLKLDYFGLKTLERSYLLKDLDGKFIERPQMMWMRTSIQIHGLCKEQKNNFTKLELITQTYNFMSELYFTHGTPTLFNSGNKFPQLSSCYLLQCPDDLEQIGDSFKKIMMISKWAGGIGINLSDIRSEGSIIRSTGGKTSGIIPLCKVLESLARYVNQSGKRLGSIACYLEPHHGDIETFIELRKNTGDDKSRARDLFLGLWISDLFMQQVISDGDWYLMNPDDCKGLSESWGENYSKLYWEYVNSNKYIKKLKARELYRKFSECMFETGMPYMMYKDTINARSNQQNLGTIKNSNLCVAPETQILTDKGYFKIKDLKNEKINVWNGEKFSEVTIKQTGKNEKLIQIIFSNNVSIDCTPNHKFYIYKTQYETETINASDLKSGMKIIKYNLPIIDNINNIDNIKNDDILDKFFVPINYSIKIKLKWLADLCDEIGCLILNDHKKSLQISSINVKFIDNIRLMLTTIGINPVISLEQNISKLLITSNHLYHLNSIGFKTNILDNNCEKPQNDNDTFITIMEINDLGRFDDTFCFNEPEKHSGIFNGILTSNCSEITEYSSPDQIAVCNLASISLPKFVKISEENAEIPIFDFESLGKIAEIITQNLNNIIDINYYPVPETSKSNLAHRPIGIGQQGLADCFFSMGYSFDSPEAFKLNKQISECIYFHTLKKSNELAKIHGPYDSFHGSEFSKGNLQFHLANMNQKNQINPFDPDLNYPWDELIESIETFGTRNSLLTCIMPTASTAQILNNNESIEPYASNIYVRKVLAGEYTIINKFLVSDLKKINMWTPEIHAELLYDNGSVQKLDVPDFIKNKYKTAYELKQSVIVKQAIDRGIFIDQSQSMNLFMESPDYNKLISAHIYAWKNGLKTGSYYIRSKPVTEAAKFSIDIDQINIIKNKRKDLNIEQNNLNHSTNSNSSSQNYEVCESCSA